MNRTRKALIRPLISKDAGKKVNITYILILTYLVPHINAIT